MNKVKKFSVATIALTVTIVLLAVAALFAGGNVTRAAADTATFNNPITAMYEGNVNPSGTTYARVSFFVPSAQGLDKDVWDDSVANNTDKILISYRKNGGELVVDQTIAQIKTALGNDSLRRTVYTYDETSGGLRLNLVFHMDSHNVLAPTDIKAVTVKSGFQWYGSGLTAIEGLGLNEDVCFYTEDNSVQRATTSITLSGAPEKTEYYVNETLATTGLKAVMAYKDGKQETVNVTEDMCSYDFSSSGSKNITVSYGGASATLENAVTVREKATAVALKNNTGVSVMQYATAPVIAEGAKLAVTFASGEQDVELTADMVTVLTNTAAVGANGKVRLTYAGATADIEVPTVANAGGGINIPFGNSAKAGDGFYHIQFDIAGETKAIQHVGEGYSSAITDGVQAQLWDCIKVGDYTLKQLQQDGINGGKIARLNFYGNAFVLHVDDASMQTWLSGKTWQLLPGFQWLTYTDNNWGSWNTNLSAEYTPVPNTQITEPVSFCIINDKISKPVKSLALNIPNEININGTLGAGNTTVTVTYTDDSTATLAFDEAQFEYDFTAPGEATVTVSYGGQTATATTTVTNRVLTKIEITTAPDKLTYDWGKDFELDLSGMVLTGTLHDNATDTDVTTAINADDVTVTGYNANKLGKQTLTISYNGCETTLDITVANVSTGAYVYMIPASGPSYEVTAYNALKIAFGFSSEVQSPTPALWDVSEMPNVADRILINGVRADILMQTKIDGMPLLTRICTYGKDIIFHFDSKYLQPTTQTDRPNVKWEDGESMLVTEVTFLAGLQIYTAAADHWGVGAPDEYIPVPGGILKENVTVVNLDGDGWMRKLKTTMFGTPADDAIVFTAPTKTTYALGEKLDIAGASLVVNFEDGGSEIVTLNKNNFRGFDSDDAGEKTVTYSYNGNRVSFTVTVVDSAASEGNEDEGCGCGSSVNSVALPMAAVALAGLAVVLLAVKKRKDNV